MTLPAAVADTHALVFFSSASKKLGKRAAAHFARCEQQRALVYVPIAVVWEMSFLAGGGRISLHGSLRTFFDVLVSNPCYQLLELTYEQVIFADSLKPNRNPFDALICAAARSLDLPLMTRDGAIVDSGVVTTIW